jgi:hypothetical protein
MGARELEWQRARKLGNREAFFRTEGEADGPLVVVYHIKKTAGSALRSFVRANLNLLPMEVETLPPGVSKRGERDENVSWYRDWYYGLEESRRARLSCVMSHTAGYLLPVLDRPAETLVLVREPVDRVLSYHYDFKRRRPRSEDPFAALEETYARAEEQSPASAKAWEYFNGQSRHLLSVFYDVSELAFTAGPSADADVWRNRLRDLIERVFFVGVQERFAGYVGELARRHGWRPFVPQGKVNSERPAVFDASALWETILACNWLDAELYELCRQAQARRESQHQVRGAA